MTRILLVAQEPQLTRKLSEWLAGNEVSLRWFQALHDGLRALRDDGVDLVIVDTEGLGGRVLLFHRWAVAELGADRPPFIFLAPSGEEEVRLGDLRETDLLLESPPSPEAVRSAIQAAALVAGEELTAGEVSLDLSGWCGVEPEAEEARVLLVDDSPEILDSLSLILEAEGIKVVQASDGLQGWEAAIRRSPALIICDKQMPRMSGPEFLACLRDSDEFKEIPFFFLTADDTVDAMVDGLENGADDYLAKPFDPRVLVAKVKRALKAVQEAGKDRQFAGSLKTLAPADLLMLLGQTRRSGLLTLQTEGGGRYQVAVHGDGLATATGPAGTEGPAALVPLLRGEHGRFVFEEIPQGESGESAMSLDFLVLEAARLMDESEVLIDKLPSSVRFSRAVGLRVEPEDRIFLRELLENPLRSATITDLLRRFPGGELEALQRLSSLVADGLLEDAST